MRKVIFITFTALLFFYFYRLQKTPDPMVSQVHLPPPMRPSPRAAPQIVPASPVHVISQPPAQTMPHAARVVSPAQRGTKVLVLPYKIDEGLAVVQGDVVVGKPTDPHAAASGLAEIPVLGLWGTHVIPYYVQPELSHPERVERALALFDGTAIRFVPYSNEEDAIVFEESTGICKSYVGKMGGKQPLWISPGCSPIDIAHEILHALGFVHEQNRADRDEYVQMHFENIDPEFKENFEKLPPEFMKVSGLGPFDFESLMIYPPWMFALNGQSTMEARMHDHLIEPTKGLSKIDVERLNKAYGH